MSRFDTPKSEQRMFRFTPKNRNIGTEHLARVRKSEQCSVPILRSDLPVKCSDLGSEKARLSKDPRFGLWAAGQPADPLDLGTFEDPVDPVSERVLEERRELMRIAAQSALDRSDGGKKLDLEARAWAKHYAAVKPLGRPLGTGEPT